MMSLSLALAVDILPAGRTGRAMGLLGATSAIGTALGPSLGGLLIAVAGWPAVFLVNVPLALLAIAIANRHLPRDQARPSDESGKFDLPGTAALAATLIAYACAMTIGKGSFGMLNIALLAAAALGAGLFLAVEAKAASPLVPLRDLRGAALGVSLARNVLVSAVMMATLVVGPFYLTYGLGLATAAVGLVLSIGPVVVALGGLPAGRAVDRHGAQRIGLAGLIGSGAGCLMLAAMPASLGLPGYVAATVVITLGYALFQTANNAGVMAGVDPGRRGVISGVLSLSRNLGLITGASAMGALFMLGAGTSDMASAAPAAVAMGLRGTFAVAAIMLLGAIALERVARARRPASVDSPERGAAPANAAS